METRSDSISFSAGASAILLATVIAVLGTAPARADDKTADASSQATVRIGLPGDAPPDVSVDMSGGAVVVDLPRSATLPLDITRDAGGAVRSVELKRRSGSRMTLTLRLGAGYLRGVSVETGALVLRFQPRKVTIQPVSTSADAYHIGVDDKLQISIDGQPDLTRVSVVGPNGAISAPFIGEVKAAGLSVDELASNLTELLGRDYLVDPHVNVEVVAYQSQWVTVSGAVRAPGRFPLQGGTDLRDAIAAAGGLAPEAGDEIVVSRSADFGDAPSVIRVPRVAFESGETDPVLRDGDIVNVKNAEYCYVQGEVKNSIRIPIERGMTLLRAITMAGGLTEWANKKKVLVLPENHKASSRTYDLRDIESLKIPDPEIHGGDLVIVRRRGL